MAKHCPVSKVLVASSGEGGQSFPELMGSYSHSGHFQHGRPVYTSQADSSIQLKYTNIESLLGRVETVMSRYLNDVGHHWSGWVLGSGPGMGSLSHDEAEMNILFKTRRKK